MPRSPLPTQKADRHDDARKANPEYHAATAPPSGALSFRPVMPYEPTRAILMQWPESMLTEDGIPVMTSIANATVGTAEVWIVTSAGATSLVQTALTDGGLADLGNVKVIEASLDIGYVGDHGPIPLVDLNAGTMAFADHAFVQPRPSDDALPTVLARRLPELGLSSPATVFRAPLTSKVQHLRATSDGLCFTTEEHLRTVSCDVDNCSYLPGYLSLAELQTHPMALHLADVWGQYLGCKSLVVLHNLDTLWGAPGLFFTLVDDQTAVVGEFDDPTHPGASLLDDNVAFIESLVTPTGGSISVTRMPMPDAELTYSYVNGLRVNDLHLWPVTSTPQWQTSKAAAEAVWTTIMPDQTHIPIDLTGAGWRGIGVGTFAIAIPDLPVAPWVADGECVDGQCVGPQDGYDGPCNPGSGSIESCWGPAWLCECGDCELGCDQPAPCPPGFPVQGCCSGNDLQQCDAAGLQTVTCQGGCGWQKALNRYACAVDGAEPGEADPFGEYPLTCEQALCEPDCEGKQCGDDGCGGYCGICGQRVCTDDGQCVDPPAADPEPEPGPEPNPEPGPEAGVVPDADPGSTGVESGCTGGGHGRTPSGLWLLVMLAFGVRRHIAVVQSG